MPQSNSRSKKSAAGIGNIRKKTVIRNGKEYTFWEARYTEGFDPGTGKQVQRSISGKTQKEVRQKLQAATSAIAAGSYVAPCKMTLGEWLEIWKKEYLGSVKPLTVKDYYNQIDNHIKPAMGAVRLDSLETHMIQRFYNTLTDKAGKPLSPKTVKNIHGVLHKALQQAIANGYISQNPAAACILPKIQKPEIKPLEPDEIALFLKEANKDSYSNLFTVAIFTGMRQGELLGLSWENVDFKNGVIYVKQQLQCKDGDTSSAHQKAERAERLHLHRLLWMRFISSCGIKESPAWKRGKRGAIRTILCLPTPWERIWLGEPLSSISNQWHRGWASRRQDFMI